MAKKGERQGLLSQNNVALGSNNLAYDSLGNFGGDNQQIIGLKSPANKSLNTIIANPETYLRKTRKFWVLPSSFTAVKQRILRHIKEYREDGKISSSLEHSGEFVESVYFDTDNLELYNQRLLQVDQSMLFRYRWYGTGKCKNGFFEEKLRKPEWRGQASKKLRFQLDPKTVRQFIKYGPDEISPPNRPPFINQLYQDTQTLGNYKDKESKKQKSSSKKKLEHTLRTEYRRTVYQDGKDASLRMTFDEDISLKDITKLTWEQALDPTVPVASANTFCFPLGILEVKLSFEKFEDIDDLEMPEWIYAMQNAGFIIQVDKFSKYCTGISVMKLGTIHRVPSWIAAVKTLMEVELARKGQEWFGMDKLPKWEIRESGTIPTRVEPREFMANERTLLKWVRMCFLALFVGLGLLGFQYEPVTGSVLIIFSLIILFRSYWMYRIRLKMLIERNFQDPFHDPWGPPLLVALFVLPTITYLAYSLGLWSLHF
mmetsp:Transcript_28502/g.25161  ORF Transcript_28502/g.25161 Transcript_28502/m.25161 type:complete len:485 (+) Transcript_28502:72-1526(+)